MLPLSAEKTPATADELTAALTRGLRAGGITPRSVRAAGTAFPKLEQLTIDVTGADITREARLPQTTGAVGSAVEISHFELSGTPLYFEKTALDLRVDAAQVKAHFVGDPADGALVTDSAASGNVVVSMAKDALETLVHSVASDLASKQGIEIRKTSLNFTQEGPRAVSFRADVTAKIFVMSATLSLSGRVDIDDELNARFAGLELGGDAMITKLAGGFIRPYLDRLEGRAFPLIAFSLGGLKLQEVELLAGPTLEVRARLGNSA